MAFRNEHGVSHTNHDPAQDKLSNAEIEIINLHWKIAKLEEVNGGIFQ